MSELMFEIPEVVSPLERTLLLELAEAHGYETNAPITTGGGFAHRPDIRNNDRLILDRTDWAAMLWPRVAPHVPEREGVRMVGLNERFRFYRYGPGQYFKHHRDGYYERPDGSERSVWTLLVFLDDRCEGGATELTDLRRSVQPVAGAALGFVHRLVHAGTAITSGTKVVLRTDIMAVRDDGGRWGWF